MPTFTVQLPSCLPFYFPVSKYFVFKIGSDGTNPEIRIYMTQVGPTSNSQDTWLFYSGGIWESRRKNTSVRSAGRQMVPEESKGVKAGNSTLGSKEVDYHPLKCGP